MPTSKKPSPKAKTAEPKPKYAIGQKAWVITHHKGKPDEIFQIEILSIIRREYELKDGSGKKTGVEVNYSYTYVAGIFLISALPNVLLEQELHPSFQSAANKFAEAFTHLLK